MIEDLLQTDGFYQNNGTFRENLPVTKKALNRIAFMINSLRTGLFSLLIFFSQYLRAQDCNCRANFDSMVSHVTGSYAGFPDKITRATRAEYASFTAQLRRKALTENKTDSCYVILRTWTNYFKDRHLRVQLDWRYREKNPDAVKRLNALFSKPSSSPISAESLSPNSSVTSLSPATLLIRLPSFEWSEKTMIDSLIKSNDTLLTKTSNWIIDIRGNGGGTDYAFSNLLPFLYTTPVKTYPDEFRSSKSTIRILEENLSDKNLSAAAKEFTTHLIGLMKTQSTGYVSPYGKKYFESKLDSVYSYPKNVAILIDRNSASSAESFLLTAIQSKKVTVFGENSAGILDYGNVQFFDIPDNNFNLVIPIARSSRLPDHPIDNIGITPNVKIEPQRNDKISFIREQLEKTGGR